MTRLDYYWPCPRSLPPRATCYRCGAAPQLVWHEDGRRVWVCSRRELPAGAFLVRPEPTDYIRVGKLAPGEVKRFVVEDADGNAIVVRAEGRRPEPATC